MKVFMPSARINSARLTLWLIVCTFCACDMPETYTYVELKKESGILSDGDLVEGEHKHFNAYTDSSAYLEAYQNFVIAKKVYRDWQEVYGTPLSEPISFRLMNANGDDISSSVYFLGIDSMKGDIELRFDTMSNTLKAGAERVARDHHEEKKSSLKVDSVRIAQLLPSFNVKRDEFDPKGRTWYKPKGRPKLRSNGIYFYFQAIDDVPSNFRMRVHYSAEDWLFLEKVQFSIDGKAFEFIPQDPERDHGAGIIWEWFDESMRRSSEIELVEALAAAKDARMKLIGDQYHEIKRISNSEIQRMKRTLELYRAMGGGF